ncbi:HAD family hydrolase [Clostridium thailandense]|uniref:HAD family hydrolase n=1 Tax=Clostridium thailandense TaxID=2794346 RepID=UPI003989B091
MNTILFDLDGTLLPLDNTLFEKIYFAELIKYFSDIMTPDEVTKNIWGSTKVMVMNLENKTNEAVFMEDLGKRVNYDLTELKDRFDKFYDTNFSKVREAVKDISFMRDSVRILKEKGYTIAVATNPLFPLKAIHHRIRWAGFEPEEFLYISSFEKNHYCKPQLKYYEEVLDHISKKPEDCIMVGNDVQEDLVSKKLGLKTYLITDNLLHRTQDEIVTDYIGEYKDFYDFIKTLPCV